LHQKEIAERSAYHGKLNVTLSWSDHGENCTKMSVNTS